MICPDRAETRSVDAPTTEVTIRKHYIIFFIHAFRRCGAPMMHQPVDALDCDFSRNAIAAGFDLDYLYPFSQCPGVLGEIAITTLMNEIYIAQGVDLCSLRGALVLRDAINEAREFLTRESPELNLLCKNAGVEQHDLIDWCLKLQSRKWRRPARNRENSSLKKRGRMKR